MPPLSPFIIQVILLQLITTLQQSQLFFLWTVWAGGSKILDFDQLIGGLKLLNWIPIIYRKKIMLTVFIDPRTFEISDFTLDKIKSMENVFSNEYQENSSKLCKKYQDNFEEACQKAEIGSSQFALRLVDVNFLDPLIWKLLQFIKNISPENKAKLEEVLSISCEETIDVLYMSLHALKIGYATRNLSAPMYGYQDFVRYAIAVILIIAAKTSSHSAELNFIADTINEMIGYFFGYIPCNTRFSLIYSDNDVPFIKTGKYQEIKQEDLINLLNASLGLSPVSQGIAVDMPNNDFFVNTVYKNNSTEKPLLFFKNLLSLCLKNYYVEPSTTASTRLFANLPENLCDEDKKLWRKINLSLILPSIKMTINHYIPRHNMLCTVTPFKDLSRRLTKQNLVCLQTSSYTNVNWLGWIKNQVMFFNNYEVAIYFLKKTINHFFIFFDLFLPDYYVDLLRKSTNISETTAIKEIEKFFEEYEPLCFLIGPALLHYSLKMMQIIMDSEKYVLNPNNNLINTFLKIDLRSYLYCDQLSKKCYKIEDIDFKNILKIFYVLDREFLTTEFSETFGYDCTDVVNIKLSIDLNTLANKDYVDMLYGFNLRCCLSADSNGDMIVNPKLFFKMVNQREITLSFHEIEYRLKLLKKFYKNTKLSKKFNNKSSKFFLKIINDSCVAVSSILKLALRNSNEDEVKKFIAKIPNFEKLTEIFTFFDMEASGNAINLDELYSDKDTFLSNC